MLHQPEAPVGLRGLGKAFWIRQTAEAQSIKNNGWLRVTKAPLQSPLG
jgi:hypothetical protein